jgi:hypothetical protein
MTIVILSYAKEPMDGIYRRTHWCIESRIRYAVGVILFCKYKVTVQNRFVRNRTSHIKAGNIPEQDLVGEAGLNGFAIVSVKVLNRYCIN